MLPDRIIPPMHLIVPFAAPLSDGGRHALEGLRLPSLDALRLHADEGECDAGDEGSLNTPHERALGRALGWQGADGELPLAAWLARQDGIATGSAAWGLVTPGHWRVGSDGVSLVDPASLALHEAESRALFEAVRPLFEGDGFALHYGAPLRWYASHEMLAHCPTASLDRVIGRRLDRWWPRGDLMRHLRRLQNEVQMLLHGHPQNERREAAGMPALNSFWLSGCGRAPSQPPASPGPLLDERLRAPALAEDWGAWLEAWAALDATVLADLRARFERGEAVSLTLCGERSALRLLPRRRAWWQRLGGRKPAPAATLLRGL